MAVIGVPHEKWGETAKAMVVRTPGSDVTEQDIVDYARERLARFQVSDERRLGGGPALQPQRQDPEEGSSCPVLGGFRTKRKPAAHRLFATV
ncbi:MAG: hypothetical protein R2713_03190 [Ilumatobacteraceae bacterium]